MKTSVELDQKKVELAKSLRGVKTIKELLDKALDSYIAQNKRQNMADLMGTGFFDGDLDQLRERKQ